MLKTLLRITNTIMNNTSTGQELNNRITLLAQAVSLSGADLCDLLGLPRHSKVAEEFFYQIAVSNGYEEIIGAISDFGGIKRAVECNPALADCLSVFRDRVHKRASKLTTYPNAFSVGLPYAEYRAL
jgi:hypothetical protein